MFSLWMICLCALFMSGILKKNTEKERRRFAWIFCGLLGLHYLLVRGEKWYLQWERDKWLEEVRKEEDARQREIELQ